ncbi:MAG TPA: dTDP-glucose 4,6-dehydratase [Rhodospirillaceae bacterium]|nr:dTDP-glucose 4,6-dehydratase [Rhodospirillaceae bacterium]HAA91600.1 dTDP-glucose 4,6-dehydratase [Rhodospirillaceae bacterium]HAT35279.1 dTDP-glucose 4,6-dehydratase [Rhodospirillaceae bacterium]
MTTYLITGGNGVFGVHTALHLLAEADPEKVICVGRNFERPEPFSLGLGKNDSRYEYAQIHITYEMDRFCELLEEKQPDVIINFAALSEVPTSFKRAWRYYDTNVTALAKMTEFLCSKKFLKRFIHIGSSEIYGAVSEPVTETAPFIPSSPYAASKAAGDMHIISIANVLGFPMNILRPSNCYGPGQLLYRILPRSVLCGLTNRKLPLQGGGKAEKSYMHAKDLARGIQLVAEKAPDGEIYNLGPEQPVSIRTLVEMTAQRMDVAFDDLCDIVEDRPGQDMRYWLDSTKITNELGWAPTIDLEEGIDSMIEWGRKYLPQIQELPDFFQFQA